MRKVVCVIFVIGLFLAPAQLFADNGLELGLNELLPVHIALMSLSGAGFITGGIIARYRKKKSKNWLKQHKAFQWSSAVLALLGVIAAVIMVENATGIHLRVTHSIVAASSFALSVVAIIAAYTFLRKKKHKKDLRIIHRWLGRTAIVAWLATIALGLFTPLANIF